jgi:predicted transposase/invertase (TIGR01784 family)
MAIYHAKDNCFKLIFGENRLFVEFLQDYVPIELLKDVQPEDIQDVENNFIPLFQDSRESDVVKRINLRGREPLFIVALVEHESKVNFRMPFKILQYICLILDAYEKEANKQDPGCIHRKDFRYPPVLPIVFYNGESPWTAEKNFHNRTLLNNVFEKYIPQFEYELVDLRRYDFDEITRFQNTLSLLMLIDRTRLSTGEKPDKEKLKTYIETIRLKISENMYKLLSDLVTLMLQESEMPAEAIAEIAGSFERKEVQPMFEYLIKDLRTFNRQAKQAHAQGIQEGIREGMQKGIQEGIEGRNIEIARKLKQLDISAEKIHTATGLPPEVISGL